MDSMTTWLKLANELEMLKAEIKVHNMTECVFTGNQIINICVSLQETVNNIYSTVGKTICLMAQEEQDE